MPSLPALCLLAAGILLSESPTFDRVEGQHYVLLHDTSEEQAAEFSRVLDAAWPEYRAFFEAEPDLAEGEKLRVIFTTTKAAFVAALEADGEPVPESGGYYAPGSRTAYLWKQPTVYYTRCLLLHEAAHQFHYLARTGNRSIPVGWYVEGVAEYLCRHRWDGEQLALGVVPLISLKDYAAVALAELEAGEDLSSALASGALSRPLSWALVSYLQSAPHRARFAELRRDLDAGRAGPEALGQTFGDHDQLAEALAAWLRGRQESWRQVFNQWEELAPGRIQGQAGPNIVSFCRPKELVQELSARLEVPAKGAWSGGLLLAQNAPDDYVVAIVFSGERLLVNRLRDGSWTTLMQAPCPQRNEAEWLSLAATRDGDRCTLRVEGEEFGPFDLSGAALGLALQGGRARFCDVEWK